jgi:hypothetical protein
MPTSIRNFSAASLLSPFVAAPVLSGIPLDNVGRGIVEDALIVEQFFPDATFASQIEIDSGVVSLRSSLAVARTIMSQVCLSKCKVGAVPRNCLLSWLAAVLNVNMKRFAMQVD